MTIVISKEAKNEFKKIIIQDGDALGPTKLTKFKQSFPKDVVAIDQAHQEYSACYASEKNVGSCLDKVLQGLSSEEKPRQPEKLLPTLTLIPAINPSKSPGASPQLATNQSLSLIQLQYDGFKRQGASVGFGKLQPIADDWIDIGATVTANFRENDNQRKTIFGSLDVEFIGRLAWSKHVKILDHIQLVSPFLSTGISLVVRPDEENPLLPAAVFRVGAEYVGYEDDDYSVVLPIAYKHVLGPQNDLGSVELGIRVYLKGEGF